MTYEYPYFESFGCSNGSNARFYMPSLSGAMVVDHGNSFEKIGARHRSVGVETYDYEARYWICDAWVKSLAWKVSVF